MALSKEDSILTTEEQLELIYWIPIRQKERFERIKRWRSIKNIPLHVKHLFLRKEVEIIRGQAQRLKSLKESVGMIIRLLKVNKIHPHCGCEDKAFYVLYEVEGVRKEVMGSDEFRYKDQQEFDRKLAELKERFKAEMVEIEP